MEASVVIPAHDEARTIGRSLTALREGLGDHQIDVVVVCNGCSDDTAAVARSADPRARVIEIAEASKTAAVRAGNSATSVFPRVHLDADVELSGEGLVALLRPLAGEDVLATAPARTVPRDGCSWAVRWYYDVWERLPQVREGLFGRGAVALRREAQERVSALPSLMGDDLAMSDSFSARQRRVVPDAVVVVRPPRTVRDLVRRRIRVVTGNAQASRLGVRQPASTTSVRVLVSLARQEPRTAPKVLVFAAVTLVARLGARRALRTGDFTTWRRDESSRS